MAKNLIPEVLKMLGVEYGEKFKLRAQDLKVAENDLYSFDKDNGLVRFYKDNSTCPVCEMLYDIMTGYYEIIKLSWEPKEEDVFYFIDVKSKEIVWANWSGDTRDYAMQMAGVIYKTSQEAYSHRAEDYEKLTGKKLEQPYCQHQWHGSR